MLTTLLVTSSQRQITYGYDLDGRQTSVTSPKGNVTGANPANFTTNTTLNAVGQPLTVTDPLGNVTTYTYDLDGNKTSVTDPDGNMTSYTYNENNQPLTTNRANGSTLLTSYDSVGNVETQTDGAGNVTSYAYNSMNELESSTTPMGEVASYSYDSDGNVLTKIDPSGDITTNTYDIDNELTSVGYSDGATPGVAYSYTPDGLVSTMTDGTGTTAYSYDSADRLISVTNGNGKTVSYGLDSDGNTTTLTYPNNKQVSQVFNNDDQLSSVTDWLSHTTHFNYDPNSNWTSTNYPDTLGTVDTNTYNNSDELTSISDQQGSNVLWSASYSLDANGQVTTADNTGSPAPTPSNAYGYNTLNQLDSNNSNNYAYDSSDNPTTINGNSGYNYNSDNELTTGPTISSSSNTNYSYNASGELTGVTAPTGVASPTNYSYDQMGNMTTVSRAKADGLAKIADSYTYDGNGLRQSETIGSTTKQLTWDQSSSVPSLLADGSTSIIYGPDSLPIEQVTGTTPLYYHHDQQGSTVMLTSQAGTVADSYSYDPAGNLLASNGTTKPVLGYDASLTDWDVGLVYLQARVYDPSISQFLTRDPLDAETGQAYEYAGDDPVNNSDPSGLCFVVSCNVYHSVGGVVKSSLVTGSNAFVAGSKFVSSHTTAITVATGISCVLAPEFCAEVGSGALITEATANDVLAIRDPNSAKACLVDDGKDAVDEGLSILPSLSGEIEGEDGTFEPALPKTITRYLNGLGGTAATLLNGIQDRSNGACGCGG
jgi:RHS repeat-associated protein